MAYVGAFASALFACNTLLGIEEQPLRPDLGSDGSVDARSEAEAAAPKPAFEPCTRDSECEPPNGCYTAHCDTVLGACTYARCEPKGRTCAMGTCDTTTALCTEPEPYGFRSATYDLPGVTLGCGANPASCVAAAFPFLFVGTRDDVAALLVDDLVAKQTTKVAITGIDTKPQQIVASGRRVWVLGAMQGQAPPYQLPIAVIDVPSDPTVRTIAARTMLVSYPFPTAVGFAAPDRGLYLAFNDPTQGFPTALLTVPVVEKSSFAPIDAGSSPAAGTIAMVRTAAAPAGTALVAASGSRLVAQRAGTVVNVITWAGTDRAHMEPDTALMPMTTPLSAPTFAQGPDGMVVMGAPIQADGPPPDCNCTTRQRAQWLFANAASTTLDTNQFADVEDYTNTQMPGSMCHVCAGDYARPPMLMTWIDRRSVLTAAPFSGDVSTRTITDVRLVARDPIETNPKRRAQTKTTDVPSGNFATDRIALTSSNGIGYLVIADGQGNDLSLSIYDPRCDAR